MVRAVGSLTFSLGSVNLLPRASLTRDRPKAIRFDEEAPAKCRSCSCVSCVQRLSWRHEPPLRSFRMPGTSTSAIWDVT